MLFILYYSFILCLDAWIIWVKFCMNSGSKLLIITVATITACGFKLFPVPFVGKTILSPSNWFYTSVKNQLTIYLQTYFWTLFYSINLPACLDTIATLSWFLGHWCTLHFHLNLRINLSFSFPALIASGIFIGIGDIGPWEKTCYLKHIKSFIPWTHCICLGFFHFDSVTLYTFQLIALRNFMSDLFLDTTLDKLYPLNF